MKVKKNKSQTASEISFHRNRKAFVILNQGLLLAQTGFEGSHFDLLCQSGFSEEQAKSLIFSCPRGYFLSENLYFYEGEEFSCLSETNEKKALCFIETFRKLGLLEASGHIYSGMNKSEVGKSWQPIKEIKISL